MFKIIAICLLLSLLAATVETTSDCLNIDNQHANSFENGLPVCCEGYLLDTTNSCIPCPPGYICHEGEEPVCPIESNCHEYYYNFYDGSQDLGCMCCGINSLFFDDPVSDDYLTAINARCECPETFIGDPTIECSPDVGVVEVKPKITSAPSAKPSRMPALKPKQLSKTPSKRPATKRPSHLRSKKPWTMKPSSSKLSHTKKTASAGN
jgi:hypothetical protein